MCGGVLVDRSSKAIEIEGGASVVRWLAGVVFAVVSGGEGGSKKN